MKGDYGDNGQIPTQLVIVHEFDFSYGFDDLHVNGATFNGTKGGALGSSQNWFVLMGGGWAYGANEFRTASEWRICHIRRVLSSRLYRRLMRSTRKRWLILCLSMCTIPHPDY